ncbi:MAG: hypothetical protein K0B81_03470 [Candidatus Cloacimonetes bacterium]|nr:hypothetical protein [Candidatus Cloacimonadota bacterium]
MKRLLVLFILLLLSSLLLSQTAVPPSIGDGTETNPYQISSLGNLYWIAVNPSHWSSYFIQTADIDASETVTWFNGQGWIPIGTDGDNYLTGASYNGLGYKIDGLFINRPTTNYIGLFGYMNAGVYIQNLRLTNINITGYSYVGGITGYQFASTYIDNCYTTGNISGYMCIGGLVGEQSMATVSNSYSTANISGTGYKLGGLVGAQAGAYSTVMNSYSTGNVSGGFEVYYVGGLVGYQYWYPTISNCYSTGNVSGVWDVGGLVGGQSGNATVHNSYSTGIVSGEEGYVGGLVGYQWGSTVTNSYWNTETSGQSSSSGGIGRITEEMTYPYALNTYVDWDFDDLWSADIDYSINDGYPYFLWQELGESLLPYSQSFDNTPTGQIPLGWTSDVSNWGVTNTNYAGGISPEMSFTGTPSITGEFQLVTPPLVYESIENSDYMEVWLEIQFRHYVDHNSGLYTLKLQYSTDGLEWTDTWSVIDQDSNLGPEIVSSFIYLEQVRSETIYLAWVFEGDSANINYWCIDDIEISLMFIAVDYGFSVDVIGQGTVHLNSYELDEYPAFILYGLGEYVELLAVPAEDWVFHNWTLDSEEFYDAEICFVFNADIDLAIAYFNPLPPHNVEISITDNMVNLSWEAIVGVNTYIIYASDDPYVEDWQEIAVVGEPAYSQMLTEQKKFYRVVASTE